MSMLTFKDLEDHVGDYMSDKPSAEIERAANLTLRRMARVLGPVKRSTFTTTPPYTTGTVTATVDSTTLTGSGTTWSSSSHKGQIVQIGGNYEWFDIDSVASTTSLVLSSAYPGATASALAYEIGFPVVTLESDVLEVIEIGRNGEAPLKPVADERVLASGWPNGTGIPEYWSRAPANTSGVYRIRLIRAPDARYTFTYTYKKAPALFVCDQPYSKSDFPAVFDDAILFGTLHLLWDQEDAQDRSAFWLRKYNDALSEVASSNKMGQSFQRGRGAFRSGLVYLHNTPVT